MLIFSPCSLGACDEGTGVDLPELGAEAGSEPAFVDPASSAVGEEERLGAWDSQKAVILYGLLLLTDSFLYGAKQLALETFGGHFGD